ncbi:MAG: TRAP-type mannitol/chloroaromatic compound transport system substrate-binding protein [Hyphomicrobiaceae bacterium]|jgi:TRAP-type mannitol/chloroaromatic compound transport system substrate-binding protein
MDRRTFLKTTTAAAAVTTATGVAHAGVNAGTDIAAPAIVTSRQELRIGVPSEPRLKDAAQLFAREIEAASGGRIVMHLTDASGPALTALEGRTIDGAFGHLPELCAAPELSLFTGLPGDLAFSPENLMTWLNAGAGSMFLEEAAATFDLAALTAGHSGAGTGLWANRPLNGLDDIANAQIDTLGLGRGLLNSIQSASPSSSSITPHVRLVEAAAQPMQAYAELPDAVRQNWYRDGLHRQGFATSLVLSLAAWHNLSAGDQLLLQTFALAATHHDLAAASTNSRLVTPAVMESLPVDVRTLPPIIETTIQQASTQLVRDAMAANETMDRAFQAYSSFFEAMTGKPLDGPEKFASRALS